MRLIITAFIKCLIFVQNFEGVGRYSTREMKAVDLPEVMDVNGGYERVLLAEKNKAEKNKAKLGLRRPDLCL